jgi:hypothetical protein
VSASSYCAVGNHAADPETIDLIDGDVSCCSDCGAKESGCVKCGVRAPRRELNANNICCECDGSNALAAREVA